MMILRMRAIRYRLGANVGGAIRRNEAGDRAELAKRMVRRRKSGRWPTQAGDAQCKNPT